MNKKWGNIGIGLPSLMMIFTVLCLTVFSTLSLLQARYSYIQVERVKENSINYYRAKTEAIELSLKIKNESKNIENDLESIFSNIELKKSEDGYQYRVIIDQKNYLEVKLDLQCTIIKIQLKNQLNDDYGNQGFDI